MTTTAFSPADPFLDVAASWDSRTLETAISAGDVFAGVETVESKQPESSLTLARLYLRQGHVQEARAILREILQRDPADHGARLELDRLESVPRKLRAFDLLPELKDAQAVHGAEPALRLALLREFLRRLQSLD